MSPNIHYNQKLNALKVRTAPRDIFDLAYLSLNYTAELSRAQIERAEKISRDLDALVTRFNVPFRNDDVLGAITTAEDVVLEFSEALEDELDRVELTELISEVGQIREIANSLVETARSEGESELIPEMQSLATLRSPKCHSERLRLS